MSFSVDKNHITRLISVIKSAPPDLVLISENGSKIKTWKLLVSLFSRSVTELLQNSDHSTAISCPVKTNEIETLVNVLENFDSHDNIIGNEALVSLELMLRNLISQRMLNLNLFLRVILLHQLLMKSQLLWRTSTMK